MAISFVKKPLTGLIFLMSLGAAHHSSACGGFFCDVVPINQAGEQIVFRQEGSETTAMIKIDYVGNAEDFGWVLPVPQIPEISLGSDQIFTQLDLNTRPQFILQREGSGCPRPVASSSSGFSSSSSASSSSSGGSTSVVVEAVVSVGPFDAQVVSSDDPAALALWLADNNLDLTDQGSDLLAPYIAAQSKFVVLKLKNTANVGSIQPIILKYASDVPVIPMTLTAVAAQNNMGVLVWLLGEGRGVPSNFKHVTPNYTRLNWFNGTRSAYASYQGLITQAMDEAGGQGFATDFAGYLPNLPERFTTADNWEDLLENAEGLSDAGFVDYVWRMSSSSIVQNAVRVALPTSDMFVYSQPLTLEELFTAEQLSAARSSVIEVVQQQLIAPLNNAIDILDDNLYLTRLYTTLSADEMNLNPEFTFNTEMEGQTLSRSATLTAACINGQDHWTLKLGAGTGREDELVVESLGAGRPFGAAVGSSTQEAAWRVEKTSATSDPVVLAQSTFPVALLGAATSISSTSSSTSSTSSSSSTGSTTSSSSTTSSTTSSSSGAASSSSGTSSNTDETTDTTTGGSVDGWLTGLLGALFVFSKVITSRRRNFKAWGKSQVK